MPARRITDADDPALALFAGVRRPELLAERGLFVAESRFVLDRALAASPALRCVSLLLTDAAYGALGDRLATYDVLIAEKRLVGIVVGFEVHQGAFGLFERPALLDA